MAARHNLMSLACQLRRDKLKNYRRESCLAWLESRSATICAASVTVRQRYPRSAMQARTVDHPTDRPTAPAISPPWKSGRHAAADAVMPAAWALLRHTSRDRRNSVASSGRALACSPSARTQIISSAGCSDVVWHPQRPNAKRNMAALPANCRRTSGGLTGRIEC